MTENTYFQKLEDEHLAATYQKIPVLAARAEGAYVWDLDGKQYLDFMSGYGVAILGHSYPSVKEAIKNQLDEVYITHGSIYSPSRAEFLKELYDTLPESFGRSFISNSGAEAVEAALKVAVKATGRKKVISMEKAYHGKTLGALSITHSEKYRKSFHDILMPEVEFVRFGDTDALRDSLKNDDVAAVFLEPIQGEGGINLPPDDYLPQVRELTADHGTLLVADEIQSGLGRTGKMWAHQHWGITPDLMTIGKGIGGGIPMGVTAGVDEYFDVLKIGDQSSTTGGNPLACAAGTAVLRELKARYVEAAGKTGNYMLSRMREELEDHRLVTATRGIGMMLAMELRIRFLPVLMNMIDAGLITLYSGINTIRLLPPYILSREQVDNGVEIMKNALDRQLASARAK